MEIYEVFEVEWPSLFVLAPSHGSFTNLIAAEKYLQDCFTPVYDRYMVIIRTRALESWPPLSNEFFNDNILTYYKQKDGKFSEIKIYD